MDETSEEPGTSSSNKEKTKVESSSNMTLCPVCQESAICHRHYGGFSCLSCKAFFRRAVTSKVGSKEKTCRFRKAGGDELCGVKRCAACRMVKCRETGMKAQFVLSGKKEALKHVGRVNKDTLERLRKLAEKDKEIGSSKTDVDDFEDIGDCSSNEVTSNAADLDTIVPTVVPTSPQSIMEDINASFIAGMADYFENSLEKISMFSDMFTVQDLLAPEPQYCPALVFTCLQDYMVQLVVMFLKHNAHFQSHIWASQAKLLRKNLPEISIIILTMFFDKSKQVIRWKLSKEDLAIIRNQKKSQSEIVEIRKEDLEKHLGEKATSVIMKVVNKLSDLELPNSVLLLLVLVSVFSRDQLYMEKQHRVDSERKEYLKMMYSHLTSLAGVREASRLTAKIHSSLVDLKQFSESIRDCEVNSVMYDS